MDERTTQAVDGTVEKSSEVARIEGDINQTRTQMSGTVSEIEQRLSPAHLKEQITDIKESALGSYHDAKDHVKDDLAKEYRNTKAKLEQEMAELRLRMNLEIANAKQAVHDATVGRVENMVHDAQETVTDAKTTVFEVVRANPIPAALVAVGLGWLLMSARSSGGASGARRMRARRELRIQQDPYGHAQAGSTRYPYSQLQGSYGGEEQSGLDETMRDMKAGVSRLGHRIGQGASEVGHKVEDAGHKVQEGVSHLAHQAQDAAHSVGEKVGNLAHQASEGVTSLAHRAGEGAGALAHDARDAASRLATTATSAGRSAYHGVEQGFENTLRDNPLALGAVALAVGAAIGLALPHTEREDEWLGGTRDRLFNRAQHAAHDMLETAEHRAEAFAGELAPKQAASTHGNGANV
jgi:hypothetical protein